MTGLGGGGLSNFQLGLGGGTGFQLVAVPPTEVGLFSNGALVYGCSTPTYPSGGGMVPLTVRDRVDALVSLMPMPPLTKDGATARLAQAGSSILQYVPTFDVYEITAADGTNSTYVPAVNLLVPVRELRYCTGNKLTVAGQAGAQRFNTDLTTDVTVAFSSPASPHVFAIHPDGNYIYATATISGPTQTLGVYRWSISGGGGAATLIASYAGLTAIGQHGLAVTADGNVVLAYGDQTGTGPYTRHFWVRVLDQDGGALHNWDLTAAVPDVNKGLTSTSGIAVNIDNNQIATDQYGGGDNTWFILGWPNTDTHGQDRFVIEVDLTTATVVRSHRHNDADGTTKISASCILVYARIAVDSAGLARYPGVDGPAVWGPPLV